MKGLDITEENLEDLLAYDDVFLDYFNAFLALPAFPIPLRYDRLTGTFREVLQNSYSLTDPDSRVGTPPYGATDDEKDRQLEWAKRERLQLFLKTHLFREMKLSKLLVRPLDDRSSASRGSSRNLRGYSRQTESYYSSLSNTGDNSGQEDFDLDEELDGGGDFRRSQLFNYERRGSKARSLPPMFDGMFDLSTECTTTSTGTTLSDSIPRSPLKPYNAEKRVKSGNGPRKRQDTGFVTESSGDNLKSGGVTFPSKADGLVSIREHSSGEAYTAKKATGKRNRLRPGTPQFAEFQRTKQIFQRAYSAPCNKREFSKIPGFDFDLIYGEAEPEDNGQVFVAFDDEQSEERTLTDMKTLEGKHKMTYQEIKEQVLGTTAGFEEFMSFLSDTSGVHLVNFWLDCEFFKDSMQNYDEVVNMVTRSRLFRDIQDKYSLNLTQDAKEQLVKSASHVGLSHTVFLRTQYDVLRRLRAYWLPRFIIHKERMKGFRCYQEEDIWQDAPRSGGSVGGFFPSISVVRSMPVRPDDLLQLAAAKDWEKISMGGRRLDERIRSAHFRSSRPTPVHEPEDDLRAKFIKALSADRAGGGPFMTFLEIKGQQMMVNRLLLWQDVADYCAAENRSSDRLLRLVHAQSIFNKYALCSSPDKVDFEPKTLANLRSGLLSARDHVPASIFAEMKASTIESLEQHWIRYLKDDLKKYLQSSMSHRDSQAPPSSPDEIQVFIQDGKIIVRTAPRKRSEASRHSAVTVESSVDELRLAEEKRRRREKRKLMEKERKKAIRAAKARMRELKETARVKPAPTPVKPVEKPPEPSVDVDDSRPVTFGEVSGNKTVMLLFKKFMGEQGETGKETIHIHNLHNELLGYQSIKGNNASRKKDIQASQIYKMFLDKNGKKPISLPEKLEKHVHHDKDRPKSPTVKELLQFSKSHLEQNFSSFWETQAADLGLNAGNINKLSAVDIAMRTGDFGEGKKKKGTSGSEKLGGRAPPTRDDKIDFLMELEHCTQGQMTLTMLYFYAYLGRWGDIDHLPFLDKDLLFYIEAQKFKENCHNDSDEELMRRKVQSMLDCFLDCNGHPSLQIDISNECYNRTVRFCQKVLHGKDTDRIPQLSTTFDDAQFSLFKALLPYWAGFMKHYTPPDDPRDVPLTKYQTMLRKRLELFNRQLTPKNYRLPALEQGQVAALSFSLLEGMKWKTEDNLAEDDLDHGSRVPSRRLISVSTSRKAPQFAKVGPGGPQHTSTTLGGLASSLA